MKTTVYIFLGCLIKDVLSKVKRDFKAKKDHPASFLDQTEKERGEKIKRALPTAFSIFTKETEIAALCIHIFL